MIPPELQPAVDLIKRYEGLQLAAYRCPAGVLTIGYGHTGPDVKGGDAITEAAADDFLCADLIRSSVSLQTMAEVPLRVFQRCALLSLIFNIGAENFRQSTLLKLLNDGADEADVSEQFHRWVFAKGQKLPGLVARRCAEAELFLCR